jgi:hypothetical protein
MSYLYDETTRRLEKDLRPSAESISFHYEMAALDDPRAAKFSAKEFWDPSAVEEIPAPVLWSSFTNDNPPSNLSFTFGTAKVFNRG